MRPYGQDRRSTGQMPLRQRHLGLTALDRRDEQSLWGTSLALLRMIEDLPNDEDNLPIVEEALAEARNLMTRAQAMRVIEWDVHPAIDKVIFINL
jgi:hypothetical protein